MNGTAQSIGFSSSPSKARVLVSGQPAGETLVVAELKRKGNHTVRVEMEGYKPFEATFTRSASGWVWGNIVFGGLIGLAIGAISGGMYKLTPDQLQADLKEEKAAVSDSGDRLYLAIVLEPDSGWEKVGALMPLSYQ